MKDKSYAFIFLAAVVLAGVIVFVIVNLDRENEKRVKDSMSCVSQANARYYNNIDSLNASDYEYMTKVKFYEDQRQKNEDFCANVLGTK